MARKSGGRKRSARTLAQYEAYIALIRAAEEMNREFVELLKTEDLTDSQYNVLRILRGGDRAGLACREISDRLIRHDPDVTRLLDRLEARGLIDRARDPQDRRVVRTRITDEGLARLSRLDGPVDEVHERQLGHMAPDRLETLRALLDAARRRG
jgi:DNA-binding MarR family transcriptional regulator